MRALQGALHVQGMQYKACKVYSLHIAWPQIAKDRSPEVFAGHDARSRFGLSGIYFRTNMQRTGYLKIFCQLVILYKCTILSLTKQHFTCILCLANIRNLPIHSLSLKSMEPCD